MKPVISAWQQAAVVLDVDIVAPFVVPDDSSNESVEFIAFVRQFGSPSGALVVDRHGDVMAASAYARAAGSYLSRIDSESYASFEREKFVSTLDDWGWYGEPEKAPTWYSGEPWST